MPALERIEIHGFKSIREANIQLNNLNVLIGANGSGKSNFISVFRFLNELVNQNLGVHVGRAGGVDSFLYFGRKVTDALGMAVHFHPDVSDRRIIYLCHLLPSQNETFIFQDEVTYLELMEEPEYGHLGSGHNESRLKEMSEKHENDLLVYQSMHSWRIYHFHDTSETAKIKQIGDIHDNRFLRPDGANLAAYLYMLSKTESYHYRMIIGTIRLVAPFFKNFILKPSALTSEKIRLEWSEKYSTDAYFNAHSLSDGTLRFIALVTLLLQPPSRLPSTILLDEPELGLHPYAITILASLLRQAAQHTQVIVSTQSVTLVNQLEPEDIIVVEREDNQSIFKRLPQDEIEQWLDGYGLGDLWEKNLLGGRPA